MAKRFENLAEMIEALQARGLREVRLAGKVATTTAPKGEQITFRGRITVAADLGEGEILEYVTQVDPHAASAGAAALPVSEDSASDLQRAQLALARQLRAYRREYRSVMQAAREQLAQRLKQAGIAIAEGED